MVKRNNSSERTKKRVSINTARKTTQKKGSKSWAMGKKIKELDFVFLTLVIVTVCVGLVMVFSASSPKALRLTGDSFFFVKKQMLFALIGFVALFFVSIVDYKKYERYVGILMIACLVMLVLVLIPGVGVMRNGSRRWLDLKFMDFQPSELMKPVMAMFIAKKIQERAYSPDTLKGIGRLSFWVILTVGLMMLETHVSGAIVIFGIAVAVMLAGGVKLRYFLMALAVVVPIGLVYLMNDPVRSQRLLVAFNPFLDSQGTGFQACQGLYSIASGGLFGQGLGQSIQKTSYLPEPYNDFIFAVICEELGLLGAILIIGLLCALIFRGIVIAMHAPDTFSTLTVLGIMSHIAIQTVFNIAVVTTLVPNTGITLPFFSYGGTAIMVLLVEMGIVLNISRHRVRNKS